MNNNAKTTLPNIVWLVQDHVTWKHYRDTAGPKPKLETYERIASRGVAFDRARTVVPLCSPARACMLTGMYPHKHGITRNDDKSWRKRFAEGTKLFNWHLQQRGYRTGYFGKWHAGAGVPADFGFEGFSLPGYGNPYRSPEYAAYLQRYGLPDPIVDVEWAAGGPAVKNVNMKDVVRFAGVNPNGFRSASAGVMKAPAEASEAFFVSQLACDWLEQAAADGSPFMLRVDVWGPHQPYLVAEPFKDTIDPRGIPEYPNFSHTFEDRPQYHRRDREEWRRRTGFNSWEQWQPIVARAYEHFAQTDAALLKVLDTLERLGLSGNTIVIYTADHGDILGSGGGLFDKDSMLTEETMSIPLAVYWPGVTERPRTSDALVSNMDIVPTVLEMAGAEVPADMDGRSILPLLRQDRPGDWREDLMAQHFGHKNYDGIQRVLYYKHYKYVAHADDSDELYDLERDPFERNNLIHDASMKAVLEEMQTRLAARMSEYGDVSEPSRALLAQKRIAH